MSIPFPWKPYAQQEELMQAILSCIEEKKIGIMESPTGTGKSLSTICSSLYWLCNEEKRLLEKYESEYSENSVPNTSNHSDSNDNNDDWLMDMIKPKIDEKTNKEKISREAYLKFKEFKGKLKDVPDNNINKSSVSDNTVNTIKSTYVNMTKESVHDINDLVDSDEKEFILDPYDSDSKSRDDSDSDNDSEKEKEDEDEEDQLKLPQILYCSRTHSQISQFVGEIRQSNNLFQHIRCISLASRKNLCVNEELKQNYTSDSRLSEACLDLQKNKSKSLASSLMLNRVVAIKKRDRTTEEKKEPCPYHHRNTEMQYSYHALGRIRDIEELVTLGKKTHSCPYYATRKSIKYAQIVCMPYSMLLHEELRKSMGIRIKDRVVIFDEAHNVIDTINQLYSAELTHTAIELAIHAIKSYYDRFQTVLHGKNLYYISLLLSALQRLQFYLLSVKPSTSSSLNGTIVNSNMDKDCSNNISTKKNINNNISISTTERSEIITANTFIFDSNMDNINFVKLSQYITTSNLINRIGGYADHQYQKSQQQQELSHSVHIHSKKKPSHHSISNSSHDFKYHNSNMNGNQTMMNHRSHIQSIRNVISFLRCLMSADMDGRVYISRTIPSHSTTEPYSHTTTSASTSTLTSTSVSHHSLSTKIMPASMSNIHSTNSSSNSIYSNGVQVTVKYVLFNPSHHFHPVVEQARSVILLGGTMKPFPYIISSLFPTIPSSRIITFSCDHVIPSHHVAPYIVSQGPRGKVFEYTYEKRYQNDMLDEFYFLLLETIIPTIESGVIIFFSSYNYMDYVINYWKKSTQFDELHRKKPIFIEPKSTEEGERLFVRYSNYALSKSTSNCTQSSDGIYGKGAILFCVMGGKLSEGINFTDDLARCVIVVGLPYPDQKDPILQERMKYANTLEASSMAGKKLYESICLRQVNQSIGRSIRHRNDYASIILLDRRYEQQHIISQLPTWISKSIYVPKSTTELTDRLYGFIRQCKEEISASSDSP